MNGESSIPNTYEFPLRTLSAQISAYNTGSCTRIEIKTISATSDITAQPVSYGVMYEDKEYDISADQPFRLNDLYAGSAYWVVPYAIYDDGEKLYGATQRIQTWDIPFGANIHKLTTSRASFTIYHEETIEDVHIEELGIIGDNDIRYPAKNKQVTIDGLKNNTEYYFYPYIIYNGGKLNSHGIIKFTTASISPQIEVMENSPTSLTLNGTYNLDGATLKAERLTVDGETYTQLPCTFTGLRPNTRYTVKYEVETASGVVETATLALTTPALELTTLQPRPVSGTCSIVAATTNISEQEPNVGFQWKKYDAPASLKPSEGYAAIFNGQLEGYIKNLQSTSYYNVRAFYKTNNGSYYYGDWVTFDPSDFSYFEPTVHTYPIETATEKTVQVRGYVLAGTDNIVEQGFQYWPDRPAVRTTALSDDVFTITATGQVMNVTIDNLVPGTTYHIRAYVKTTAGFTYGETQTFSTKGDTDTGIGNAPTKTAEPVVTGYYDLNGRRLKRPAKGINIVRYSDGTARKIVVRQ